MSTKRRVKSVSTQPPGWLRNFDIPLQEIRSVLKQDYSFYDECLRKIIDATAQGQDTTTWLAQMHILVDANEAIYFSHQGVMFLVEQMKRGETIKITTPDIPSPTLQTHVMQAAMPSPPKPPLQRRDHALSASTQSISIMPAAPSSFLAISMPVSPPATSPTPRPRSFQFRGSHIPHPIGTYIQQRGSQYATLQVSRSEIREERLSDILVSAEDFDLALPLPVLPDLPGWIDLFDPGQPLWYNFKPREKFPEEVFKPGCGEAVLFSDSGFKDEVQQFFKIGTYSNVMASSGTRSNGKVRKEVTFGLGDGPPPIVTYDPASDDLKEWQDCIGEVPR